MQKKFRAITSDNKIIDVKEILFLGDGSYLVNKEFPIEEGKLLLYTGYKDDNGKEIYESDIKKHHDYADGGHDAYVVKFGAYPGGIGWYEENVLTHSIHSVNLRTGKVIGNIFQHPYLLA